MIRLMICFISFLCFIPSSCTTFTSSCKTEWKRLTCKEPLSFLDVKKSVNAGIKNFVETIVLMHRYLFTLDTFKIITITFPFYGVSRGFDEKLQKNFFDHNTKKNKNNPPHWCAQLARFSITPPIVYLGLQSIFSYNEEMRITAQTFLIGLPFVLLTKDIIKKLRFKSNLRPYHEILSPHERCGGGFPSGHMAEAMYTAVLFGMRFGYAYAVPLSIIAGFLGTVFVACNRHYSSQVVAGAAFGAIYAVAANRVVDWRLNQKKSRVQLNMTYEDQKPGISLAMSF